MKNASLKTLLLSTALTMAATSASFAEGWNGFRIGAGGGGNFATTDLDSYGEGSSSDNYGEDQSNYVDSYIDTLSEYHPDSYTRENLNEDAYEPLVDLGEAGAFGTVEMGADLQASSLVMGLTANYDMGKTKLGHYGFADTNQDADDDTNDAVADATAELTTDLELGNTWAVGGRMGFLPTESTLIFVSGGYQRTKANLSNSFDADASVDASDSNGNTEDTDSTYSDEWDITSSETEWLDGYYVGGGIETMLGANLSMKMEYRFSNLDALSSSATLTDESAGYAGSADDYYESVSSKVDPILHSVRATIGFRF